VNVFLSLCFWKFAYFPMKCVCCRDVCLVCMCERLGLLQKPERTKQTDLPCVKFYRWLIHELWTQRPPIERDKESDWPPSALPARIKLSYMTNKTDLSLTICNYVGDKLVTNSYQSLLYVIIHSKQCWVVLTQIWVKYGQTQMMS